MKDENLALSILLFIMLVIMMLTAYSLWRLKERVEDNQENQLQINEYILNRIGG